MSVLDRRFAALADPTRRQILDRVAAGPVPVSVLAEPLRMTLPGVLKHVRVLEEAELVVTAKIGRSRMCALGPRPLDDVADWVSGRRRHWATLLDRFAEHLAERPDAP
jgi:DNA-binding transcriptional ArsR family regulator